MATPTVEHREPLRDTSRPVRVGTVTSHSGFPARRGERKMTGGTADSGYVSSLGSTPTFGSSEFDVDHRSQMTAPFGVCQPDISPGLEVQRLPRSSSTINLEADPGYAFCLAPWKSVVVTRPLAEGYHGLPMVQRYVAPF